MKTFRNHRYMREKPKIFGLLIFYFVTVVISSILMLIILIPSLSFLIILFWFGWTVASYVVAFKIQKTKSEQMAIKGSQPITQSFNSIEML